MSRNHTKAFIFTRTDLEQYLIDKKGAPEDIVVTGIKSPANQEGWVVTVHSASYPELGDMDTLDTSKHSNRDNSIFEETKESI